MGEFPGSLNHGGSHEGEEKSRVFLLQISDRRKVSIVCLFVCLFVTLSVCTHSGADVYDRVSTFLETLYRDMEKGGCGDNALLVSHGLFCRLFLTRYFHWRVNTVQFHLCSSIPCSVHGRKFMICAGHRLLINHLTLQTIYFQPQNTNRGEINCTRLMYILETASVIVFSAPLD